MGMKGAFLFGAREAGHADQEHLLLTGERKLL
jgi:hypothetical protein